MPMAKVIGFDPASVKNLGWSLIEIQDGETDSLQLNCTSGTVVLSGMDGDYWKALWPIFLAVDHLMTVNSPDMVVIEKTSSFAGGFITGQVSACIGVILACCGKHELSVGFVYPTHVKKIITGDGRATKSQMKKGVTKILNRLGTSETKFDSPHAVDAVANVLCWLKENHLITEEGDDNGDQKV